MTRLFLMTLAIFFFPALVPACSDESIVGKTEKVSTVSSNRQAEFAGSDIFSEKIVKPVSSEHKTVVLVNLSEKMQGSTITIEPGTFAESINIEVSRAPTLLSENSMNHLNLDSEVKEMSEAIDISFDKNQHAILPVPMTVSLQINENKMQLTEGAGFIFVLYRYKNQSGVEVIGKIGQEQVTISGNFARFRASRAGIYQLAKSSSMQDSVEKSLENQNSPSEPLQKTLRHDTADQSSLPSREADFVQSERESRVFFKEFTLSEGRSSGEVMGKLSVASQLVYFRGYILRYPSGSVADCQTSDAKIVFSFSSAEGTDYLFIDKSDLEMVSLEYRVCIFDADKIPAGETVSSFIPSDRTLPPEISLTTVYTIGDKDVPIGGHALKLVLPEDRSDIAKIEVAKLKSLSATSCREGQIVSENNSDLRQSYLETNGVPGEEFILGVCTSDHSENTRLQLFKGRYRMDHLIVLSSLTTGQIGSLEKADELCQRTENSLLYSVKFKAVLSDSAHRINAKDRIMVSGYIRTFDGQVFSKPDGLWTGSILNPVLYNAIGVRFFESGDQVFTGTRHDGFASGSDCKSWTSANEETNASSGNRIESGKLWMSSGEVISCSQQHFIYCISQSQVNFEALSLR